MKRLHTLLAALALGAAGTLTACDGLSVPNLGPADSALRRPTVEGPAPLTLTLGQSAILPGSGSRLTFERVVQDSRCPMDVTCVWAGEGQARFTLHTYSGQAYSFTLALPGGTPEALPMDKAPSALKGGYIIHLLRLQPYPGYAPEAGMPVTATVVAEPCPDLCVELPPPDGPPVADR